MPKVYARSPLRFRGEGFFVGLQKESHMTNAPKAAIIRHLSKLMKRSKK